MKTVIILSWLALTTFLLGCQGESTQPDETYPGVTVEMVADSPEAFYEKAVVISGEVDEVLADNAAVIGGGEFAGGRLLVVSDKSLPKVVSRPAYPQIREGDIVQVHGIVRNMDLAEIERNFSLDLDQQHDMEFKGAPVFVASQTIITGRNESDSGSQPSS